VRNSASSTALLPPPITTTGHGYEIKPSLALIKDRPGCAAYHEITGGVYDQVFSSGRPVTLADLFGVMTEWDKFHDVLGNND
jgi:hypothetical protein